MTRVTLYARYSSDNQNAASIEAPLRIGRERAEREGWHIVRTYEDAAISGSGMMLRPGAGKGMPKDHLCRTGCSHEENHIKMVAMNSTVSRDPIMNKHLAVTMITARGMS